MSTDLPQSKEAAVKLADSDFSNDRRKHDMNSALLDYWHKIKAGELGALPAILGLIALVALFTALKPETFLSKGNIANLATQALPITILAMGLVFVLLLGEIDLAAGVSSGVCATVMAKLMADSGQPWYVAVLSAIAIGVVIGTVIGWLVAFLRIPSFVVTLAFFLGLQGITLWLIGEGGTVPVRDDFVVALSNKNMPIWLGWALAIACVIAYTATLLLRWRRQHVRNLHSKPLGFVIAQCAVVGLALLLSTYVLSLDRAPSPLITLGGIPWGVLLVGALLVICTFVLGRTGYGRHIYAVGGNAEAARRAGINVTRIRISVFMIASALAAISGIVAASRLNSVATDAGGGNTLLYAVGAAVIGGTSLFGGRGKARDAVLGGLVIALIANGLGLLGTKAYLSYLITGVVLLFAASIDALARRRRSSTGR
ncbi:sugar ABC transporter permease [Actinomadura citrea]|jgi:D-xylose transport system permease protein|uniref:Xylose transport system permease protein XylH n=1 Tax=Actinomadura citrea TaxID=46158 RepID=A0A7Y9G923_9ACTN|nr:ABC transporter permease [Actinomadura citrea]NYE12213.1 D-xylose transport system permease protein [Actinomadura citrea]GGT50355.1 ABC transporter permease [Actinomadura citrea]